jgi:hypothetical protein
MKIPNHEEKKPECPAGMRSLKAGEKVQKGDQKWTAGKWEEVAEAIDLVVLSGKEGFYCRKV